MSTYPSLIYEKNLDDSICRFHTIQLNEYDNVVNNAGYIYSGITLTLNFTGFTSHFDTTEHTYSNIILNNDVYAYTGLTNETHYFTIYDFYSGDTPSIDPLLGGLTEDNVITGFSTSIISCADKLDGLTGTCCPTQAVLSNLPWVAITNEGGGSDNCSDYIARRTEKGWTLDYVFNKNGLTTWTDSVFFYTGVRDEYDPENYADNNLSFKFTSDGRIKWSAYRYSGYCDTVSGYTPVYYISTGQTLPLCSGGTSNDFNITINFERYYYYTDCEIPNEGGWNDLINTGYTSTTGSTIITDTQAEELNQKWLDERNKRLGTLKIYLNGRPQEIDDVHSSISNFRNLSVFEFKDWEEVVLSDRGYQPFAHAVGGGVTGSGNLHNGVCCYTIKYAAYFEDIMNFPYIYNRYLTITKPNYSIVECNEGCDDSVIMVTPLSTPSITPTPSISPTITPSITITPSLTPTITPSLSASRTITPTKTPTKSPPRTPSETPTLTPTMSLSKTPTPTPPITRSQTRTLSRTPSVSPSITPTITPCASISKTPSLSKTPTRTPSLSPSITLTITPSMSISRTSSQSRTPSVTSSLILSITPSITPSITLTPSRTPSKTLSITPTVTPSTSCIRPEGLSDYVIYYAYSGITGYTNFTNTFEDACDAISLWPYTDFLSEIGQAISFTIGETLYSLYGTNCEKIPNGYYISWDVQIVYVLDGIINTFLICPSPTPSSTPSLSISATPSMTPTVTPSLSETPSITPSLSETSSITPTITPSLSISETPSITPSLSETSSITPTITPSLSETTTPTPTPSLIPNVSAQNIDGLYNITNVSISGDTLSIMYPVLSGETKSGFAPIDTAVTVLVDFDGMTTGECLTVNGVSVSTSGTVPILFYDVNTTTGLTIVYTSVPC